MEDEDRDCLKGQRRIFIQTVDLCVDRTVWVVIKGRIEGVEADVARPLGLINNHVLSDNHATKQ